MIYTTNTFIESVEQPETFGISEQLAKELRLIKNKPITLEFGVWKITGQWRLIKPVPGMLRHLLSLNSTNFTALPSLPAFKMGIKNQASNHLKMGPVIGVFLSNGHIRRIREGQANFRNVELARANDITNTFLYFFSINDIDWVSHSVQGSVFVNGSWHTVNCPLPDVLYDRAGGFLDYQLPVAKYIRKQFDLLPNLKRVNTTYHFSKYDVNLRLDKYEEISAHIPQTVLFTKADDLREMIERYKTVYVKSFYGNNGLEVMRVRKKDNGFEYGYIGDNPVLARVETLEEVIEEIGNFLRNKKCIVQQGVDVLEYEGGNVDLRVLVQKGIDGIWGVTDIPVRIGNPSYAVTSTRTGARVFEFMDIVPVILNCSSYKAKEIYEKIRDFCLNVAQRVVEEYGDFGEVGIDIALDKSLNIWFIEVNAKPGKDTVYLSGNKKAIQEAFLRPLEYGLFLTEFVKRRGQGDNCSCKK